MKHTILPNGDLQVTLDSTDDREEIAKWRGNEWWELFADGGLRLQGEGWSYVAPEWIGALTDAPILTDDCTYHDNGEHEVCGNIWWFPNYQVEDVIETLIRDGAVTFQCVDCEGNEATLDEHRIVENLRKMISR